MNLVLFRNGMEKGLRVRLHPKTGVYVEGLSKLTGEMLKVKLTLLFLIEQFS